MPVTEDTRKSYPSLPRALRAELLRQVGTVGVKAIALKSGVNVSTIYNIVKDPTHRVQKSSIEKLSSALVGTAPVRKANGAAPHVFHDGMPPSQEFTLRVSLGVKRAERLVAHCDLHGISMSQFVGKLIDERLDAEWGEEKAS